MVDVNAITEIGDAMDAVVFADTAEKLPEAEVATQEGLIASESPIA